MWTAAIAAGGQARRLDGRDTSALRVGDASILERHPAVLPITDVIRDLHVRDTPSV